MRRLLILFAILSAGLLGACHSPEPQASGLQSPDGALAVALRLEDGKAHYAVVHQGDTVLGWSPLGLTTGEQDFSAGLSIVSASEVTRVADDYTMLHGKATAISYRAQAQTTTFQNAQGQQLAVQFRVSNDGVAFRYEGQAEASQTILHETTGFQFVPGTKAWLQPMSAAKTGWEHTNPSYEEPYFQGIAPDSASPIGAGWAYPALFQSGDNWLLISEAGLGSDYCASRLDTIQQANALKVAFPQAAETMEPNGLLPQVSGSWHSPWRIIAVGDLATVTESTLGTDLAEPAITDQTDWIAPGISSWSWVLYKDDSTVYSVQKRFIDYAAEMQWEYCLIDADWDRKIGYEKMAELVDYAKAQGIGIILWYNSAGDWNTTPYTPKHKMVDPEVRRAEFARLQEIGVAGLKIDFFGGDGRSVMAYYQDIMRDALAHNLVLNFHGATLPRGWHRTYPNLMTMESIKGQEFITFTQETANMQPQHCATIPFTRNVFDPMDFTPMVLGEIPGIERVTSNGFELALPTLFTSGVQHIAENPEGMATVPQFVKDYLAQIPVAWDETRLLSGFPGQEVVMARRKGERWYVAGINGEAKAKQMSVDLSGLQVQQGMLIRDGEDHRALVREEIGQAAEIAVPVLPYGGFVLVLE